MRGTVMRRARPARPAKRLNPREATGSETSCSTLTDSMTYPEFSTRRSVLRVFVGDDLEHLVRGAGGQQAPAELGVLEQAADPRQRLEVHSRRVLGRDEHEEEVRRAAVHRVEVDAVARAADARDELADGVELAVRDGDALADRRRGEPLPVDEDLEQRVARDAVVVGGEMVGELGQQVQLRLGLEVRQDQVLTDEVDDLHDVAGAHTTTSSTGYKCPW